MKRFVTGGIALCLAGAGLAPSAIADPTLNGWDTDVIYVLRRTNSGAFPEGEIRKLDEAAVDPAHSDLGRFGADLSSDGKYKSICFSNSPVAGVNSPAGARMWGVSNWPGDLAEPNPTDFFVQEFAVDSTQVRKFYGGSATLGTNGYLNGPDGRVYVGNIRYNPAKNTIAVAANIALEDAGGSIIPGSEKGMVYEFALPDWPTGPAALTPVLVQRYEMPVGHRVTRDNGAINVPLAIDFDDEGNMYVGGQWFDANGDGYRDVIRLSTIGHNAGLDTYVVPIAGADAANMLIDGELECDEGADCTICNNNPDWQCGGGGQGLSWRPGIDHDQLVVVPNSECSGLHTLLYNLSSRQGGGATGNLVLDKRLESVFDIPRGANYAQRDADSGKIYIANRQGDCGGEQNFMYLNNDSPADTVTHDVGYFLTLACGANCNLNKAYDAASPPPPPVPTPGACCMAGNQCEETLQNDCSGEWLGAGIACGEIPCPVVCADPAMDVDADHDVDQKDFAVLQQCYTDQDGGVPTDPATCLCFNQGADGPDSDIDAFDVEAFEACASGPDVPADPCCDGGPGCP